MVPNFFWISRAKLYHVLIDDVAFHVFKEKWRQEVKENLVGMVKQILSPSFLTHSNESRKA